MRDCGILLRLLPFILAEEKRNTTTKEGYNRSLSLLRRRRLILDPVCLAGGGGEGLMRVFYSLQSQASSPSSSFEVHVYGRTGVETIVAGGPPIHFYPHTPFSQRFINFLLPWRRELSPLYCILSVLCAGRDRAYPKIHSFSFQNENHLARPAPPASHPPTFFRPHTFHPPATSGHDTKFTKL